jgi:ribosomal protein S18 acetylase RimI-like enzyme
MVKVELATDSDTISLWKIDRLVPGSSERRSALNSAIGSDHCFKATDEGEVRGFMILEANYDGHAFISFLVVHPGHRREGIASALMRYAESVAPTDKLYTSTNASNTEMQRLCEALGFVRDQTIETFDDEDREIVYIKDVQHEDARSSNL